MKSLYKNLPESPGVYFMRGKRNKILYIGKAGSLRRRVSSYFTRNHDPRLQLLVSEIKKIDHIPTDSALEALILEAYLIKKHQPPYNILEKDDKSFLYVEITSEKFPRILLVRGKSDSLGRRFGPFISASSIRTALRIIRKIFPYNVHPPEKIGTYKRPCFDYEVGLCPGTCIGGITQMEYSRTIRNISNFFQGKKKKIVIDLGRDMKQASKQLLFEKAEVYRRQIFALKHIQDIALISEADTLNLPSDIRNGFQRIEGYDISNISGTSAVGSMVVFVNGKPSRDDYRKFKIKSVVGPDDVGMLKEILVRRFKNKWSLPSIILVDGGVPQVRAARSVVKEFGKEIPIVGIAKGTKRRRNDFIGIIPEGIEKNTLIKVRDEAHRFAISYHRHLRGKRSLGDKKAG